jgi:hemolysin III
MPDTERLSRPAPPRLRGQLHLFAFPASIVAGMVLVAAAPSLRARIACAVYALTVIELFGVSAAYHRGSWSAETWWRLKRLDHANIFLLIAGTYTPICLLVLHGASAAVVLATVWAGAAAGMALSVWWPSQPRWLLVPTYVLLGWVAIFVLPQLLDNGGVAVLLLIVLGGVLYTLGGLVYGLRRPDPLPDVFGFHEVFHALTIAAFATQYVAVSIAAYRLG